MTHRPDDPSILDQRYQLDPPTRLMRSQKAARLRASEDDPDKVIGHLAKLDHSANESTLDLSQVWRASREGLPIPQWRRVTQGGSSPVLDEEAQLAILADVALGGEELAVSKGADLLLIRWIVRHPPPAVRHADTPERCAN